MLCDRHLPLWGFQLAPLCMPMDCCTIPSSPTARTGPPLQPDSPNVSEASLSSPSAVCEEHPASQPARNHCEADQSAPQLLQPVTAAASLAQTASPDTSETGLGCSLGGPISSGCSSQQELSAKLGAEGVSAEPHQAHAAQEGIEGSHMIMSPPKRKAPAAPREEPEAEAMQHDKMPRFNSCRRLSFF